MPNWAWGTVETTGTMEAVLAFSKRFIADDDEKKTGREKFFARSFLNESRERVENNILSGFTDAAPDEEKQYDFYVDFALSAYSCVVDGYPQQSDGQCITLEEACAEDGVDVVITTKEPGMYFEERLCCTRDGELTNECAQLRPVRCRNCGYIESIASFESADDMECCECGSCGFENIEMED